MELEDEWEDRCIRKMKDCTDGKTCFFSQLIFDDRTRYANNGRKGSEFECYLIHIRKFMKINKGKRIPIMKITHCWNYKDHHPQDEHSFWAVIDLRNHRKVTPFHLNFFGTSTIKCGKCSKYFFDGLNHFPISFVDKAEYGEYKFEDLNMTISKFLEQLEKNGFYQEFKNRFI